MRIFVVDDELDARDVVVNMLKLSSHDPVTGKAGLGLFDELAAAEFDLVLTDLSMPHITGWDIAAWIRSQYRGQDRS